VIATTSGRTVTESPIAPVTSSVESSTRERDGNGNDKPTTPLLLSGLITPVETVTSYAFEITVEPVSRQKAIRATVARFPSLDLDRNYEDEVSQLPTP
jgi:hypothetical protein